MLTKSCRSENCYRPVRSNGLCNSHYSKSLKSKAADVPCVVVGCNKPGFQLKMCQAHYKRDYRERNGLLKPRGPKLPIPYGDGYMAIWEPDHPNAMKQGYVQMHVKVMSDYLGRPLRKGENVHHKNGVRDDNRPENLELWVSKQPPGQRVEDLVSFARDILSIYGEEFRC